MRNRALLKPLTRYTMEQINAQTLLALAEELRGLAPAHLARLASAGLPPPEEPDFRRRHYRIAEYAQTRWQRPQSDGAFVSDVLMDVSQRAWMAIDWLPARATALGFAIVGSFEDAMDGWRNHAEKFPEDNDGVILAATAGQRQGHHVQ